jgi:DNA (cytosine-5)-methyltransferase 1
MKHAFSHEFACEKDKYALESIAANYSPKVLYTDITKRKHSELPDIDLYVCGFPCQPFSAAGKRLGMEDHRSNIMQHCIKVIRAKKPKYFILENVKNFKSIDKGGPFEYLLKALKRGGKYNVYWDILNTRDYGIPQNRERIFFIGIRKDIQTKEYETPSKLHMKDLDDFIEDKTVYKRDGITPTLKSKLEKYSNVEGNYIITATNYSSGVKNVSPTLTTGCGSNYHKVYNRYLTPKECLNLQGFKKFNQVVSNTQMYRQAGNSMSVNVLKAILKEILESSK